MDVIEAILIILWIPSAIWLSMHWKDDLRDGDWTGREKAVAFYAITIGIGVVAGVVGSLL